MAGNSTKGIVMPAAPGPTARECASGSFRKRTDPAGRQSYVRGKTKGKKPGMQSIGILLLVTIVVHAAVVAKSI